MSDVWVFQHHCNPRHGATGRESWTCQFCGKTWEPVGETGWRTDNEHEATIAAVTMRYPDGSERVFVL